MQVKTLAASILLASSASAFAVGPGSLGMFDNTSATIGRVVGAGAFDDVYTFTLADPGMVFGGAYAVFVSGFQAELLDASFSSLGTDVNLNDGFSFGGLAAGSYALHFSGLSGDANGAYGGAVTSVTSPIPEPETYAMLLAGLGMVGFMIRRSRRA